MWWFNNTLLRQILSNQERIMQQMANISSELSAIQANQATMATAITAIATGVAALDAELQKLAAQIASGASTLTPTDQAALDAVLSSSAALVTQAQGVDTSVPSGT